MLLFPALIVGIMATALSPKFTTSASAAAPRLSLCRYHSNYAGEPNRHYVETRTGAQCDNNNHNQYQVLDGSLGYISATNADNQMQPLYDVCRNLPIVVCLTTVGEGEKNSLVGSGQWSSFLLGYVYGTDYSATPPQGTHVIHRFYLPVDSAGDHIDSSGPTEWSSLLSTGWQQDSITWYAWDTQ